MCWLLSEITGRRWFLTDGYRGLRSFDLSRQLGQQQINRTHRQQPRHQPIEQAHPCRIAQIPAQIADVALEAGFADQAHFQRAFKQHLAATPGQYRG